MATDIAKPKVTPGQVLEDMARLTPRQLESVMERAAILRFQKSKKVMPERESELLQTINSGLNPEKSQRLAQLQTKLRDETLSRREHGQLLRLTDELERLAAERLKALMEVAAIRKTTVPKLMKDLHLTERGYA